MINVYVIKKYATLMMCGFIPVLMFVLGDILKGFIWGIGLFFMGMLLTVVAGNLLLRNPFSNFLEGKGLLVANLDSTGIVPFFNIKLERPHLRGEFYKQSIEDTFDREAVFNMIPPEGKQGVGIYTQDGGMLIKLNNQEYNKGRMVTMQYPLLIWNDQIKSLITKDFLSDQEKHAFAEHQSLHLNQQMNSLTSVTRDFARYVVEQLKPLKKFFSGGAGGVIAIVLIVIVIIVLAVLFGPKIIALFNGGGGGGSNVADAVQKATDKLQTINPR